MILIGMINHILTEEALLLLEPRGTSRCLLHETIVGGDNSFDKRLALPCLAPGSQNSKTAWNTLAQVELPVSTS
jgi:hypothetical protein